ncbi:hypothetical protein K1T71_014134 [Dendrolimus kikuchii]|uniref:Uncharacterized protein n=1 Tax=Dendrolimus kikuchii TaxID=765133 RepID=A0ACC1CF82_9NEOP|nr:hypothetical protein K1T71_014134 [Dendrolimus kikuchii]
MGEDRSVRKAYLGRPVGRRPVGRPKYRWKDRLEADLSELGASKWQETAQDQEKWHVLVSEAKTHFGSLNAIALRVQYNNGFRMLMGLPRFCSASGMFAEARVDDYYAVVRKRAASLLCRIRASSNNVLKVLADRFDVPAVKCGASKCKASTMIVTKV